jgi:hypothetical protein
MRVIMGVSLMMGSSCLILDSCVFVDNFCVLLGPIELDGAGPEKFLKDVFELRVGEITVSTNF